MTTKSPRIRRALVEDAPAMAQCAEAAYRHYLERMEQAPGPMLENYSEVVREHAAFVLEEASGEVVGFLVLIDRGDAGLLLDNVAVLPRCQGSGYGRCLIDFAEREAVRRGYVSIDLYTHECMTENIGMYRRMGYVETERRTEKGYARIYMRKPLGN